MEIIRMKQKQSKFQNIKHNELGLAFLESIVALVFLFPFIFEIMGIMDYYRISYTLEERINNEFGNRKEFAIKLDNNFKVKNLDDINDVIRQKINNLKNNYNGLEATYKGTLQIENNKNQENIHVNYDLDKKYFVVINGKIDFLKNRRYGYDFLKVMPRNINITKKLLVTYEFENLS